jgi:hypothetical protein
MSDATVVSLGDALVRESDLNLLSGPYWLNDRIISFFFEYLHQVPIRLIPSSPEKVTGHMLILYVHKTIIISTRTADKYV